MATTKNNSPICVRPKWRRTKAQVEKDKAPDWRRMKAQVEKDEGPEAETLSRLLITYQGNPCGVYPDLSSFTGSGVYPDLSSFTGSGVYPDLSSFTGSGVYPGLSSFTGSGVVQKLYSLYQAIRPVRFTSSGIRASGLDTGRHRSHLKSHSHRRENERKPQEDNINLPYFNRKENVEAYLDWEIRVEQKLKRKSTLKSYGSHSYPKKYQGLGILRAAPSKPKDDKGKTIEKQPPKASMQEKTSSIKCFKCLGTRHITSQCLTKKTMIMRSQDIYSSQYKATTSPSSSESEEAKGEESSEEIYPQEEGQPLMFKEKCKEEMGFQTLPYFNIPNTTNTYVFVLFTSVEEKSPEFQEPRDLSSNPFQGGGMMQSYPTRALD
ncbi:hypothetical protein HKD37_03G006657 [Glycine soja]